eukprot:Nk52_evm27s228 gene=Nk52_evmTU27s228
MDKGVFFNLGVGVRFNKSKYRNDIARFEGNAPALPSAGTHKRTHSDRRSGSGSEESDSGSDSGIEELLLKKGKRKRESNKVDKEEEEEDLELDFFGCVKPSKAQSSTVANNKNSSASKRSKSSIAEREEEKEEKENSSKAEQKNVEQREEEMREIRRSHKIHVSGEDIDDYPMQSFKELVETKKARKYLLENIMKGSGYATPSPIQMQAIPSMMKGKEVLACAPTGSGKTAAFLIPILAQLKAPAKKGFRAVIVSPTRELAEQIYRESVRLSEGSGFKIVHLTKATALKANIGPQSSQKFDMLICTPMRLVKMIQEQAIVLRNVEWLVLDEADRLFELGFLEQMDEIIAACDNPSVCRALFSATLPQGVEEMARSFLRSPLRITIGAKNSATDEIDQKLVFVGREDGKLLAMRQRIQQGLKPPVIIFVQSIERAKALFHELVYDGINVDVIHAERTAKQRENIVKNFRLGKIWVLIATELMARGLDFKGVNLVINYDFPQSATSYIHRVGRTGRAGRKGEAITYFTEQDVVNLRSIANVMKESGCEVPDWMLKIKGPSKKTKRKLKNTPLERKGISTMTVYDREHISKKKQMVAQSKKSSS